MLPFEPMQRDEQIVYRVPRRGRGWELPEETMPESVPHDAAVELLRLILVWWARGRQKVHIARNLAVRWDAEEPRIGADPDVCVLSPAPPDADELRSVRTWLPEHAPPLVAIEVVSETNPHKDYVVAPDKYAASGTRELWIFDPLLAGPNSQGGPFRLQIWQRDEQGRFVRSYAGDGPGYSQALSAHLVTVDGGRKLRLAEDASGTQLWLTGEEAERAAKEAERAAKEAERAAKEAERAAKEAERAAKEEALARVAVLEAALRESEKK
jgi:Uma2 family endonuclease